MENLAFKETNKQTKKIDGWIKKQIRQIHEEGHQHISLYCEECRCGDPLYSYHAPKL